MTKQLQIANNKVVGAGECLGYQEGNIHYQIFNIAVSDEIFNAYLEDDRKVIYRDGEIILNPNYDADKAEQRRAQFLQDFFKVGDYGYYRRIPKGYQSAVESMNVLFNIANVANGIQAGLIIFYQEPDFTKPEECTEEWLVAHQIIMPAMTKEAFIQLYVVFMTAWNTEEHNENTTDNE